MNAAEVSTKWGLPAGFQPVRFAINDQVKQIIRGLLGANEPVIVTVANESDNVAIVATTQRVFTVRTGQGAGVTGVTTREFPWEAITDMRLTQMGTNVKIAIHFKSKDGGRTAETGKRAAFGKDATDELKPFETNAGTTAFEAIHVVYHFQKGHVV